MKHNGKTVLVTGTVFTFFANPDADIVPAGLATEGVRGAGARASAARR